MHPPFHICKVQFAYVMAAANLYDRADFKCRCFALGKICLILEEAQELCIVTTLWQPQIIDNCAFKPEFEYIHVGRPNEFFFEKQGVFYK